MENPKLFDTDIQAFINALEELRARGVSTLTEYQDWRNGVAQPLEFQKAMRNSDFVDSLKSILEDFDPEQLLRKLESFRDTERDTR